MKRKTVVQQIINQSQLVDSRGYVADIRDNLIATVSLGDFQENFLAGNGNELNRKAKAVHSSSVLCANFFGFFKSSVNGFVVLGESNFLHQQFEKKLPTGLRGSPANLDFYLENDSCIIGIESKFLEPLAPKIPKFSPSYEDGFLDLIHYGLSDIVRHYKQNDIKSHLDTAQLIKHSIGLLKEKQKKKKEAKLIYLYWEPVNASEFSEYSLHKDELTGFSERIKGSVPDISFHHFSYWEFCNLFANNIKFEQHLTNFKDRYLIKVHNL
ncbi:MAG TPA: hypothetical protein VD884_01180 [Ohtaekwangia sp.]|nr:hypothetical protein [Ohtaekwangia sp.]